MESVCCTERGRPDMVKSGIYADLPLPEAWQLTLSGLKPSRVLAAARPLPSLGVLVDACLALLSEKQAEMVWGRLGAEQTLQEVGDAHQITRERVRQVVGKVTRTFLKDPRLRPVLDGVVQGLSRNGATLVDVTGAQSVLFPQATPEQLWRFVIGVWNGMQARQTSTHLIQRNIFLFCPIPLPKESHVRQLLCAEGSFLSLTQLAYSFNLTAAETERIAYAFPQLVRTSSGLYGHLSWTLPVLLKAVAEQLAHAGFTEWHFSEIGKAAAVFNAEWGELSSRNVAAALSRTDVTFFESAGRKGYWRLRTVGDGHAGNRAAIRAVLEAADFPLHWSSIQGRLGRQVQEGTVTALLNREPEFEALGRGVYGLRGKVYQEAHTEETFMAEQFRGTGRSALPAAQVLQLAQVAGLDPERLLAVGRVSSSFRYWNWGSNDAQFLTTEEAHLRHFQRWFAQRENRDVPSSDILRAGLYAAYRRHDRETLQTTHLWLTARNFSVPPEAMSWVDWALG